jgi:hypothetical protein
MYFTVTLGAVALLALLLPYAVMAGWRREEKDQSPRERITIAVVGTVLFAVVVMACLAALSATLQLDFVERYSNARATQADWNSPDYNFFWVRANAMGWFVSFGLAQSLLMVGQQARAVVRTFAASMDGIDELSLAWLCLFGGLLVLMRQHGETNRLWTFLSPIACILVARLLQGAPGPRRYTWPLMLAFLGLLLYRYRLSYF